MTARRIKLFPSDYRLFAHGEKVDVESTDQETRFTFRMPIV